MLQRHREEGDELSPPGPPLPPPPPPIQAASVKYRTTARDVHATARQSAPDSAGATALGSASNGQPAPRVHSSLHRMAPGHRNSSGPFNLDDVQGLHAAARACGRNDEVVLFTSNRGGLLNAANMALQLRALGIPQHMVLADERGTCTDAHAKWAWLGCGWSRGLVGFENRYGESSMVKLWSLWSAKWLVVARLVELRVNVLGLDTDMLLLSNPYTLLHSAQLAAYTMVLPPEGSRVNLGFLYVRGKTALPGGGAVSVLWDVVRRLRLFLEDYTLMNRRNKASMMGLWDQGLYTDALISAMRGEHIYPYTYLQAPHTGLWKDINWPSPSLTVANLSSMHVIRWKQLRGHLRPPTHMPPRGHPQEAEWRHGLQIIEWQHLTPLPALAALHRRTPAGENSPGWIDPKAHIYSPGNVERVAATPDWLYCLVGRWAITAGWPGLRPNSVCSVLHLVETRSAFGSWDYGKSNRPYVMQANGHWHLDDRPKAGMQAVRLSASVWHEVGQHKSIRPLLNALQLLALVAAVMGRVPIVPRVPCSSRWLQTHVMTLAGISDDYVMQLRERGARGRLQCHLAMGGRQCSLPQVLPAWYSSAYLPPSALGPETLAAHPAAGASPDVVPVPVVTVPLTLTSAASPGMTADAAAAGSTTSATGDASGDDASGGGTQGCSGARKELSGAIVASLRAAKSLHASTPILEVGVDGRISRCATALSTDSLWAGEMSRLSALRGACSGYFAAPAGKRPDEMSWIHRHRLPRRKRPRGQ